MVETTVPSGQIGTFDFTVQAPAALGSYNEYFNLVAEGHTWLNDLGLFFTINVNNSAAATNTSNKLLSGSTLNQDDVILSPDRQSALTLQRDGNLVLYSNFKKIWSSGTASSGGHHLVMQTDGNLVLYTQGNVAVWNSETGGHPGAWLNLQTDGNMVVYSSTNSALWLTGSSTIQIPDHLDYINTTVETGRMYPGQSVDTADRRFHLILQPDGNLVLYSPTKAIWATGTDGKSIAFLAMQPDGNMVLYDRSSKPVWYSSTNGRNNLHLVIQQDGNLVLYNGLNIPVWNTSTSGAQ